MLNKTFIITEFGDPFSWTQQYIYHVQKLKKDGWNWKIFTPNKYDVPVDGNVEVVPMTAIDFAELVSKKLRDVKPQMWITTLGVPSVHITDYYVFTGIIFKDYLKNVDYWGITNMDIVYGDLSKFLPDSEIKKYDIWTDDVGEKGGQINGIFSLWKNIPPVNNLCFEIEMWREKLSALPCPKCATGEGQHHLFGTDEIDMVPIAQRFNDEGKIKLGHPPYYPLHSYDRLEQHMPDVKLRMKPDGSLYELFIDRKFPQGVGMFNGEFGKEIMYFHFIRTKQWPLSE